MSLPVFEINDAAFHADPLPTLRAMREAGGLVAIKMPIFGTLPALTRYNDVSTLLRDSHRFARDGRMVGKKSAAGMQWWMPALLRSLAENMLAYDGEDHRRLRSLVDQAFQKRNVDSMRDAIEHIADRLIDELETEMRSPSGTDLLAQFARQFPLAVICELLGLPDEDRPKFTRWFAPLGNFRSVWGLGKMIPGLFRIRSYLRDRIRVAQRCSVNGRTRPDKGLITELVRAEQDGAQLSEDEMLAMIFLLLVAGHETTTHLIADGVLALIDHPAQKDRLVDDWSLASSAIDEVLRYTSPVQMTKPRFVVEDLEWCGRQFRRGDLIIGSLACANHDPNQFKDPDRFDIARSPNRHLSFGSGIHVCLGLKLAKLETAIAFERLWTRFPSLRLAIPRDQICWRSRIGIRCLESLPVCAG